MPVYFIHQISTGEPRLKIRRAKDIFRRRDISQIGNPETLVLVGWINTNAESALEAQLDISKNPWFGAKARRGVIMPASTT
ncbi:hypothetical protein GGR39_003276 [Novosphingobium fluoreni]|uniref:GIY-YIG nuclease family protein n=1 Tax=Novosphingobium fluoreni TaxID=1391222 RepID=A0A7W6FZZ1_9SPHN|nr:hypothetical protein [Novosphingobium fluoreni]MBB3941595.1 hypothetical protein [Novosphingobium fluoreni]